MYAVYGAPQGEQLAWQQWGHGLMQRNEWLEKRQSELEARILRMEEQLSQLEEANRLLKEQVEAVKPVQYGNITYKVQELHVNELTGTLNIGLTSLADEGQLKTMMEQMKLDGQELQIPGSQPVADSSG
jgi:predicted nuclease with TOPRIM domain